MQKKKASMMMGKSKSSASLMWNITIEINVIYYW